ncbi:helix-turn-helix domain-containing protein [Flagellimonas sp. DF-77]|uniref:winged helix-turn-helix transcriptional regulator n=1 Tax=Flagellimonas algarum TaxID=3230298 RepID=UPI0033914C74
MRKRNSVNFENRKILEQCGLTYAMTLLEGRWKLNILWAIHNGYNRYGKMKQKIQVISEKMLTQRLKELVDAGIITRNDLGTVPPHVEYDLSEKGKELITILELMRDWGNSVRESATSPFAEQNDLA